jgi:hypothetical protein
MCIAHFAFVHKNLKWSLPYTKQLKRYWHTPNSLRDSNVNPKQKKNNGRVMSWGTLLGLQHFRGVEGRAGTPGWD